MATKQRKSVQKKTRRKVQRGVVHILATFNNTLVTISDRSGLVIAAQSPPLSLFPYQSAPLSPRPLLKEVRRCKGHGCARPRGGGTRRRCEEAPGTAAP